MNKLSTEKERKTLWEEASKTAQPRIATKAEVEIAKKNLTWNTVEGYDVPENSLITRKK